ncbi:MAG: DUF1365 family protein [Alphaproteobacteria bacterium]|nr:DUF1365 family protein [Alphaproteobacteria bacterium]
MSAPAARYWIGRTVHRRETPFVRRFSHAIAMVEIDIDRICDADVQTKLFSVNSRNVVAFRETDHGARNASVPLRVWAEARFAEADIGLEGGAIRLIAFPRILGHGFAPISLWLGHGPDGDLRGVIYEVHNTFGEAHVYVSPCPEIRHEADKSFFVSPFFEVSGRYRFTLRPSDSRLELVVENLGLEGRSHVASLLARPRPLTDVTIIRQLFAMPLSGLGVVFAIHWQALLLWARGARYHIRPVQRADRTSLAKAARDAAVTTGLRKRA